MSIPPSTPSEVHNQFDRFLADTFHATRIGSVSNPSGAEYAIPLVYNQFAPIPAQITGFNQQITKANTQLTEMQGHLNQMNHCIVMLGGVVILIGLGTISQFFELRDQSGTITEQGKALASFGQRLSLLENQTGALNLCKRAYENCQSKNKQLSDEAALSLKQAERSLNISDHFEKGWEECANSFGECEKKLADSIN